MAFLRGAQLMMKRSFDLLAAGSVLVFGWPAFAAIAALVKATSPGPVLFVQERAGKGGKTIRVVKFRSMAHRPDKDQGIVWNAREAADITGIGHFLRDYGLDELPQIINIIRGDMSVVGPRPALTRQAAAFSAREKRMLEMRPGVLSLAAIRGRRGISLTDRYEWHAKYVDNWSLKLDFEILLRSFLVVVQRRDAEEKTT